MPRDVLHPRPQFTRKRWTDLCGTWEFAFDDANSGLKENWMSKQNVFDKNITVPFPPESSASGIGDNAFHPVVWYRRTFKVSKEEIGDRLILHFGAVDYEARVWVNGQLVVQHEGGNTPFSADITPVLKAGSEEQVIVVRAEDQPFDLTQPRGKQFWEENPRQIWYHRTTGIWQPVWLEPVGETYITAIEWTPDLDRGMIGVEIRLNTVPKHPLSIKIQLSLTGATLANDTYLIESNNLKREIALQPTDATMNREKLLWSPRFPNLVDAVISLKDEKSDLDEVESYLGIRSVGFSNNRFLLNGRPYYLRLVLEQGYWPESHLAAPSPEALRREVELIKSLGFNGVRIHQKVEDPRFLYWCDRLGLMVWGEMANAYVFSTQAVEKFTREWLEVVRRDYSHPCIITWVPLNESWGVPNLERDQSQRAYVKALYHLTHAIDPTRPVIGNDGWEHMASDVWGIHDYALDGDTIRERYGSVEAVESTLYQTQPHFRTVVMPDYLHEGEPIMLTECGGINLEPESATHWWGYATVSNPETYLSKYADLIHAILDCPSISGFCYTQLTDTEQETNGLLKADRTPKLDPEAVFQINQRPAKSQPGELISSLHQKRQITSSKQEQK